MRNDSSPNVRGIAIVIIVKSVKGHIAGNDFLRGPRIDYAAHGYQSCYGLECKSDHPFHSFSLKTPRVLSFSNDPWSRFASCASRLLALLPLKCLASLRV